MFDFAAFKRANLGGGLASWQVDGYQGTLEISRKSALELEDMTLGLHVVASYDGVEALSLSPRERGALVGRAYEEFLLWKERVCLPGDCAMSQQDVPWGTRTHLHIHFYVAEVEELKHFGFKPRRSVDPLSRIEPIAD